MSIFISVEYCIYSLANLALQKRPQCQQRNQEQRAQESESESRGRILLILNFWPASGKYRTANYSAQKQILLTNIKIIIKRKALKRQQLKHPEAEKLW